MSAANTTNPSAGTALSPNYHAGPVYAKEDMRMLQQYFTYQTDSGLVTGKISNVAFTIDRPTKEVWPWLKDFNLWQNSYGYYYSGVVGDLEGETFYLDVKKPDVKSAVYPKRMKYQVVKVIPEQLIVLHQPVPDDGSTGGVSPGFHVFTLVEHDGKTEVSVLMSHAARTKDKSEEETLVPWRKQAPESERFWKEIFVPTLRKLVHEGNRAR